MTESPSPTDSSGPEIRSICHPTDFSPGGESAFAHALAFALLHRAAFTLFHTDSSGTEGGWTRYPAIRETLARWGRLPRGSSRSAVYRQLGVEAQKVRATDPDPTRAVVQYLDHEPADLVVLATRGRDGMPAWLNSSVAEKVARRSQTLTLFVPKSSDGFVSFETGEISLRRILIAVDHDPRPDAALAFACGLARRVEPRVEIRLLHVGKPDAFPELAFEEDPAWDVAEITREGDVVDEVLAEARAFEPDLIAMTTAGRQGFLDALRGSTTEQVLRGADCPVLAVPG